MRCLSDILFTAKCKRTGLDAALWRKQLSFLGAVGIFVIITSFCYGLLQGLKRPSTAMASSGSPMGLNDIRAWVSVDDNLHLPHGVRVMPLGKNTEINGQPMTIVSFISERGVRELLSEQVKKWEKAGLFVFGMGKGRRGVALAMDKRTGERFAMSVWRVPPGIRRVVSDNMPVQGMLSIAPFSDVARASDVARNNNLESSAKVPGVPLREGGVSGGVFSSKEQGFRSYSGNYISPGTVEDNVIYYRDALPLEAWEESSGDASFMRASEVAYLHFVRGEEEIVLLLSPAKTVDSEQNLATVIVVARGRRQDSGLRALRHIVQ